MCQLTRGKESCLKENQNTIRYLIYVNVKCLRTKDQDSKWHGYYCCDVLILYVKWYNITWDRLRQIKDIHFES